MPSISSPIIKWRNFRLTPLELLIIVLTILGIIFLVSTWNRDTENGQPAAQNASVWEQATQASEHTAQMLQQLNTEIIALQQTIKTLEQRLQKLEQGGQNTAPPAANTMYTVKPGDTLSSIAQAHNVSLIDLRAWNKLSPSTPIKAGQKLSLVPVN